MKNPLKLTWPVAKVLRGLGFDLGLIWVFGFGLGWLGQLVCLVKFGVRLGLGMVLMLGLGLRLRLGLGLSSMMGMGWSCGWSWGLFNQI